MLKITLFTLVDLFYYYLYFCSVCRLTKSFATTNLFLVRNKPFSCTTSGFSKIYVEVTTYCVVMFRVKNNSANTQHILFTVIWRLTYGIGPFR